MRTVKCCFLRLLIYNLILLKVNCIKYIYTKTKYSKRLQQRRNILLLYDNSVKSKSIEINTKITDYTTYNIYYAHTLARMYTRHNTHKEGRRITKIH